MARREWRHDVAAVFADPLKGSTATYEVQSIRFPGPEVAIVTSKGGMVLAGQTEPTAENRSLETWVLTGRDGIWHVEAFHNCPANAT